MLKFRTEKKEIEDKILDKVVCDVCKKEYNYAGTDDIEEVQEFQHIRFTGGYGSIFGDDVSFETDICQHCLKEKLGEYIRVVDK